MEPVGAVVDIASDGLVDRGEKRIGGFGQKSAASFRESARARSLPCIRLTSHASAGPRVGCRRAINPDIVLASSFNMFKRV
jgi:hypothetical protein